MPVAYTHLDVYKRQLYEFCPELTVLVARGDREFVRLSLAELLPHGFGPKSLT